jgi:cyclopropane fatty-acyl-phospholipid synthase-like methyltransferase
VVGITLSVEQKAWAEDKVKAQGLQDLITFQLIDYRWALDGSQRL